MDGSDHRGWDMNINAWISVAYTKVLFSNNINQKFAVVQLGYTWNITIALVGECTSSNEGT